MNTKTKKRIRKVLQHTGLIIFTLIMLYPLAWMVMSSFKESSSVFVNAHRLIPEEWDFTNFTDGWQGFGGITFTTFF